MKKAIIGVVALGAVLALRPVVKRRMLQKMRAHCEQMAAKCKEMMAGQPTAGGEAGPKVPEHCEQMAEQFEGRDEAVVSA